MQARVCSLLRPPTCDATPIVQVRKPRLRDVSPRGHSTGWGAGILPPPFCPLPRPFPQLRSARCEVWGQLGSGLKTGHPTLRTKRAAVGGAGAGGPPTPAGVLAPILQAAWATCPPVQQAQRCCDCFRRPCDRVWVAGVPGRCFNTHCFERGDFPIHLSHGRHPSGPLMAMRSH